MDKGLAANEAGAGGGFTVVGQPWGGPPAGALIVNTVGGNTANACVPGIENVAGSGARAGCELARFTVAPPGGTPAVSCTATRLSAPLYSNPCVPWIVIETGLAGSELMVKR